MELPYFKLYIIDFQHGTSKMSVSQKGGYINMLIYQWDKGGLPQDREQLLEISELNDKNLDKVLKKFFLDTDGLLKNSRLETERQNASKVKKVNGLNGSKGGKQRAANSSGRYNSLDESEAVVKRSPSILQLESDSELQLDVPPAPKIYEKTELSDMHKKTHAIFGQRLLADVGCAEMRTRICTDHNWTKIPVQVIERFNDQLAFDRKIHLTVVNYGGHIRNWLPKGDNAIVTVKKELKKSESLADKYGITPEDYEK